jgi:hypothetical protein
MFIAPYSKLNMLLQVNAVITCGIAQGKIKNVLKIGLNFSDFLFKIKARKTPITTWKETFTNVQINVLKKTE